MAIYVKFAEEKKPRTIKEFLIKFYSYYKTSDFAKGYITYSNKECTSLQCEKTYRSFDDLLELVQTYYPSTTVQKFIKILLTVKIPKKDNNTFYKPHLGICSGMGKIRFIPYNVHDLYDYKTVMKNSKYTWEELLKPLGINDKKDLINYHNK